MSGPFTSCLSTINKKNKSNGTHYLAEMTKKDGKEGRVKISVITFCLFNEVAGAGLLMVSFIMT